MGFPPPENISQKPNHCILFFIPCTPEAVPKDMAHSAIGCLSNHLIKNIQPFLQLLLFNIQRRKNPDS